MAGSSQDYGSNLCLPPTLDGQLKLGDRVTIFKDEQQFMGTVRWIGGVQQPKPFIAVGIETVSDMFIAIFVLLKH